MPSGPVIGGLIDGRSTGARPMSTESRLFPALDLVGPAKDGLAVEAVVTLYPWARSPIPALPDCRQQGVSRRAVWPAAAVRRAPPVVAVSPARRAPAGDCAPRRRRAA